MRLLVAGVAATGGVDSNEKSKMVANLKMEEKKSFDEIKADIDERMKKVKNKIMVMSGKGGVGKTTVAVNLAFALEMNGLDVGLLDADIHGPNVPKMLNLGEEIPESIGGAIKPVTYSLGTRGIKVMSMAFMLEKDAPVVWRGPLKMGAIQQFLAEVEWGNLDYLIIDLPPGTGDEPLSLAQLISDITGSVIVTTPQEVALMDSRRSVNFSKMLNVPVLGIIENMSGMKCPHCDKDVNIFGSGGGEKAARELGVNFLGRIPIDPRIVENSDSGTPFMIKNPKSESTRSFKDIVDKIKGGK